MSLQAPRRRRDCHARVRPQPRSAAQARRSTEFRAQNIDLHYVITFHTVLNWHVEVIHSFLTTETARVVVQAARFASRRRCLGEMSWNQQQRYSSYSWKSSPATSAESLWCVLSLSRFP